VTGTGNATRDLDWISRNIKPGLRAEVVDVTSGTAVLSVMGPNSRSLLQAVSNADLSNAAHPFATWREIFIGGAPVRALRVTYVGELGWELHMPTETAPGVYDRLMEEGRGLGVRNAGYRAIESLRLEKGYRAWGSDITSDDTPLEAGLGFAVKLKSNLPFQGRDALAAQAETGLKKRLACFTVDDPRSSSTAARRSIATARGPGTWRAAAGATRSAPTSATAMSATPRAWTRPI
jgi:sarcosine dehydrogenase